MTVEHSRVTVADRSPRTAAAVALRALPLSVKVMATLALVLWPLGAFMVVRTMQNYAELNLGAPLTTSQWITVLLPLLMWTLALLTGWWLAHSFVVQPLRQMQQAVRRYSRGDRSVRLADTQFYSRELDEFATAFDTMALDLGRGESELRIVLAEQQRLTREVHHRVKNNLQIVASLLSIQSRGAPTPEVAAAYAAIQVRVGALALVHRWMYGDEGQPGINLKALLTDLAASLEQGLATIFTLPVHLHSDIDQAIVDENLAVPVAFLVTELLSSAARLSNPQPLRASITGRVEDGKMTLTIAAPIFCTTDLVEAGSLHPEARVLSGMARQLRAPLLYDASAGQYAITIPLVVRDVTENNF